MTKGVQRDLRAEESLLVEISVEKVTVFKGSDNTLSLDCDTAWSTSDLTHHVFIAVRRRQFRLRILTDLHVHAANVFIKR